MPRLITVELPDEVYEPLLRMSAQVRRTPQEVVGELVAYAMRQLEHNRQSYPDTDPPRGILGEGAGR